MKTIAIFAAILSVAAANLYTVATPTWNTQVKSDRVGNNWAYSVKENPTWTTYAATAPVAWNWNTAPATTWTAGTVPVSTSWVPQSVQTKSSTWNGDNRHWNTQWNTPSNHWDTNWNTHNSAQNVAQPKAATWTAGQQTTHQVPATTYKASTGSVVVPGWNSWNYASAWPVHGYQYQVVQ